jgi:hypothetical protein
MSSFRTCVPYDLGALGVVRTAMNSEDNPRDQVRLMAVIANEMLSAYIAIENSL